MADVLPGRYDDEVYRVAEAIKRFDWPRHTREDGDETSRALAIEIVRALVAARRRPATRVQLAELLVVRRLGTAHATLFIDGEAFNYATIDGFTVGPTRRAQLPAVHLSVAARRLELLDDMRPAPEPEDGDG
jgi:hypothetical protein